MGTYFEDIKQWRVEFLGFSFGASRPITKKLDRQDKFRPYVNFSFSDLRYQTKRKTVWALHRARYGWAVPDTWSFDYYLADVIIGGLKHLKENKSGIPSNLLYGKKMEFGDEGPKEKYTMEQAEKRWNKIIDQIVEGFEAHKEINDGYPSTADRKDLEKKFDKGMKLFAKYYGNFWD